MTQPMIAPEVCAGKLKILADATRLKILEALMNSPKHVNEINHQLQIEQSLLSHHLKLLRDVGLVESQRDGKAVLYSLGATIKPTSSGKAIDLGCCQLCFGDC